MKNLLKFFSLFAILLSFTSCIKLVQPDCQSGDCNGQGIGGNGQTVSAQQLGLIEGDAFQAEILQPSAMNSVPFQGYNGVLGVGSSGSGVWNYLRNLAGNAFPLQGGVVQVTDVHYENQYSNNLIYIYRVISVPMGGGWKTDPFEIGLGETITLSIEKENGESEEVLYKLIELEYTKTNEEGQKEEHVIRVLRKQ